MLKHKKAGKYESLVFFCLSMQYKVNFTFNRTTNGTIQTQTLFCDVYGVIEFKHANAFI